MRLTMASANVFFVAWWAVCGLDPGPWTQLLTYVSQEVRDTCICLANIDEGCYIKFRYFHEPVDIWHLGNSIEGVNVKEPHAEVRGYDGGIRCCWYMEIQESI